MSSSPPSILHPPDKNMVPHDIDAYNIVLFPQDLLTLYHPELTLQLVSHAPTPIIKDNDLFKDWTYIAQAAGLFKIDPKFKQPLLHALTTHGHLVIKPSPFPLALIKGKQTIAVGQLADLLIHIGCTAVRLQVYGQKHRLLNVKADIGNPAHPLSDLNTFDLGYMHDNPCILLVQPLRYNTPHMVCYPMLLPLGLGYGSVHMSLTLNHNISYHVKAYPRLVHCIKAESGNQALWAPDTVRRARARHTALKNQIKAMHITPRTMLGGLRLEVTIQARTLLYAKHIVQQTPLLNLDAYLHSNSEIMQPYQLRILAITKADYLANLTHLLGQAEKLRVFRGDDHAKLRPHKKQILMDLFNALGWNTGRMKSSAFDAADAWWLDDVQDSDTSPPQPQPQEPALSLDHIKGVPAMKALFLAIRSLLPCQSCPTPGHTYIWDGHTKQFRLKCKECNSKLNQTQARAYILQLVTEQHLQLPHEYQPEIAPTPHSPTPITEVNLGDRIATPPPPAAHTTMQLRSRTARQPTPPMQIVIELPWTPILTSSPPLPPMVDVPGLPSIMRSTSITQDGNCLFRAMAHHLFWDQERHLEVRAAAVKHLHTKPQVLAAYAVEGTGHLGAKSWLTQMAKPGTWGDELALLALAQAYSINLWVWSDHHAHHSAYQGAPTPHEAPLGLIHLGGNHYEILCP